VRAGRRNLRALPRSVVVTGASGGIGEAIARELARAGSSVTLSGRNERSLVSLADELPGATVLAADLETDEGVDRLVDAARAADGLVLNAGLSATGRVHRSDPDLLASVLAVNLTVPLVVAARVLPQWVERGSGALVVVGSMAAKNWRGSMAAYNASKAGVRALTWSLRQEHVGTAVHIGLVTPGPIREVGMFARQSSDMPAWFPTRSADDVGAAVVRSIREGPGEIAVAPSVLRLWGALAATSPSTNALLNRLLRADQLVDRYTGAGGSVPATE